MEYLFEIARQLLRLHVERAEATYSRCVYNPSALWCGQHLAEGGGVHTLVVRVAYLRRAQVGTGYEGVDDG